jgi:hypothetical protein
MSRKLNVIILCWLLVCSGTVLASGMGSLDQYRSKGNEAGYSLIDTLIGAFQNMAEAGIGGYEAINSGLQELMGDLKKAREQKKVDMVFYNRYKRMLVVMKLAIIDKEYDRESILGELISGQLQKFVFDVSGKKVDLSTLKTKSVGIGVIAAAVADELLNLHQYLDGKKYRQDLLKSYQRKILGTNPEGKK